jgi:hypothetical protein
VRPEIRRGVAEAAIRDDRIHNRWGPGVRNTLWITWLYSKYTM